MTFSEAASAPSVDDCPPGAAVPVRQDGQPAPKFTVSDRRVKLS
jgi:hypothetical protein